MENFKSNPDKTILTISVGLLVVYYFSKVEAFLLVAIAIGLVGIFSHFLATKIEWFWMKLAQLLSYIVPNIVLSIVFYFILTPIALLSRIGKKNPFQLKNTNDSVFKDRVLDIQPSDFEKTW
jgi:Flp pilus assembly pilin Flp